MTSPLVRASSQPAGGVCVLAFHDPPTAYANAQRVATAIAPVTGFTSQRVPTPTFIANPAQRQPYAARANSHQDPGTSALKNIHGMKERAALVATSSRPFTAVAATINGNAAAVGATHRIAIGRGAPCSSHH